jgi:tetratricopeptide (TPR) repeat protein
LVNWRLYLYRLTDFKNLPQPEWKNLQSACQRDLAECTSGLEQLQKNNPQSEDIFENLILAYLNRGDDVSAIKTLNAYAQALNWPQGAVDLFFVLGIANQIPAEKLKYEGQLSSPLGILAVIEREIEAKNYKEALKFIKLNLGVYPQYPQTYVRAAQLYYDRGFPELARTVIQNGYINTQAPILEAMLYQLNAVMYSNTNILNTSQDLSPVVSYGLAFASLKSQDTKAFENLNQKLAQHPIYQANLKATSQIYSGAKVTVPEPTLSYHAQWIAKLDIFSRLQNPTNFENLKDIINLGYKHPAFLDVDQTSNYRTPAGGL